MNWRKRSVVERMKPLLEGLYVPDSSSSLLISRSGIGALGLGDDIYWDFVLKLLPQLSGGYITTTDQEKGLVVALREAISEMALPGNVRVETIDDNSWRLGRLHGMRRVGYEQTASECFMVGFQNAAHRIALAGAEVFINLHLLVAAIVLVIAALIQNIVLIAAIMTVVIPPVIKENMNWRSLQKQRLARLVLRKEGGEREAKYRKRLREACDDPDEWNFTKAFVHIRISHLIQGKLVDRYREWNASHRASIRLAMMSASNDTT